MASMAAMGGIGEGISKAAMPETLLKLSGMQQQQNQFQEDMAMKNKTLIIAQDKAKQERNILGYKERDLQRQEEIAKSPIDITVHPAFLQLPEQQRPEVLKFFQSRGFVNERGVGETGKVMEGIKEIEGSSKLFTEMMGPVVESQKQNLVALEEKAIEKPDDVKLQQQLQAARKKYQISIGTYDKHLLEVEKKEMEERTKLAVEELRLEGRTNPVAHNTIEQPSPDGKTAQRMQYNPATQRYDIPVGNPYPVKSQVISLAQEEKKKEGFASWLPEAKHNTFMYNAITGKPPVSAQGLASNDRQMYGKEFAQWQVNNNIKSQDMALMQADYRAGDVTLKSMARQEAPMAAFVGNINKQIDKVRELYDNNDRLGIRMIDLPIRELKVRAKGSGDEAVKASYLLEISNEIGKLSSGASASIQQLSDSAKEDWKRVHDPNLSFKEIMKVVNATRDQANMRMESWREAKQAVRMQLKEIGVTGESGGGQLTPPSTKPTGKKIGRFTVEVE